MSDRSETPGACRFCGNTCDLAPGDTWTCPHCGVEYAGRSDDASSALARARARYTDPHVAIAELDALPPVRRLETARARLATARRPAGRFGLDACPPSVIEAYECAAVAASIGVEPLRRYLREARGRGLAWSEVWGRAHADGVLDRFGAAPGDARLLGVLDAGMDEGSRAKLAEGIE